MSEGQLQRLMVSLKEDITIGDEYNALCDVPCGNGQFTGGIGCPDCGYTTGMVNGGPGDACGGTLRDRKGGEHRGPGCQAHLVCDDGECVGPHANRVSDGGLGKGRGEMKEGPNPANASNCPNPISCQNHPYMVQAPPNHPTQPCECVRASSLQRKRPDTGGKDKLKNNLKEMRKLRTTQPINEAQVDNMLGWFNRLNKTGTHYNPVNLLEQRNGNGNGSNSEGHGVDDEEQDCQRCLPNGKVERKTFDFSIECPEGWVDVSEEICCPSICCEDPNQGGNIVPANPAMGCRCSKSQTEVPCSSSSSTVDDEMVSEVKYTYNLIRKAIIKENIRGLNIKNYRGSLLTEQGMYDRNPGIAAAEGIENIIDNLKKGWAMIKDSTTRKQIQNTLTKLNNFMTYSAELIGSGSSQRAPRTYDQLANPLPFPELDEPEDLEDIDDGLEDFDEDWRKEEGKRYHNKNNR